MRAHIRLGRLFGIPIGLHYSWVVIAVLITVSLAAHFKTIQPGWSEVVTWTSAVVTGSLFFVSIILHELAHALVAKANGTPVHSITMFALGGVAQMEAESKNAQSEFGMAIAGPLASLAIGFACLSLALALGWSRALEVSSPAAAVAGWLGYINIVLALFNMIPGFPLDGGRVLRAVLWWLTDDGDRATRVAAQVGQIVAYGFIGFGLLGFFRTGDFGALWLTFIGWFLLQSAQAGYAQVSIMAGLRGVRVGDMMEHTCEEVDPAISLQAFVDEQVLRTGHRCFIVIQDDRMVGLITPTDVRHIERSRWPTVAVREVMRPFETLHTVVPEMPATEALTIMSREDINQLPVVTDGRFLGLITRSHILQFLQARAELRA